MRKTLVIWAIGACERGPGTGQLAGERFGFRITHEFHLKGQVCCIESAKFPVDNELIPIEVGDATLVKFTRSRVC